MALTSISWYFDSMKNDVFFVGGGSGGHVVPAKTLIEALRSASDLSISYVGDRSSIEFQLIKDLVPFYGIKTGKLRRYFSWQNFTDVFKIFFGFLQSLAILIPKKQVRTLVFSTGGFVAVPLVLAARVLGVKVYIHEQTSRVGLANRICSRFASKIFISFESSRSFFPPKKVVYSGYPVRKEFFLALDSLAKPSGIDFSEIKKPVLFITGGGNGSLLLNELVKKNLEFLSQKYFIVHQVGEKFFEEYSLMASDTYRVFSFINDEMPFLLRRAELVISRAGAGTVSELLAIQKKSIYVPLKIAQKNEQFFNAMEAKNSLGSMVLSEDEVKDVQLPQLLDQFYKELALRQNENQLVARDLEHDKQTKALGASKGTAFLVSEILSAFKN